MALFSIEMWASLFTLTLLEIILGIDNLIFISIMTEKLPAAQVNLARRLGLIIALVGRLGLLATLSWLAHLKKPIIFIAGYTVSWHDLVFILGGGFLLWKASKEIYNLINNKSRSKNKKIKNTSSFLEVIIQIVIMDLVFSLDSMITAVGLVSHIGIISIAIIISVIIMLFAVNPLSTFIHKHPTIKMLAFCLLILIGITLVAEGIHIHIPKEYIYFSVTFSVVVEILNMYMFKHSKRTISDR